MFIAGQVWGCGRGASVGYCWPHPLTREATRPEELNRGLQLAVSAASTGQPAGSLVATQQFDRNVLKAKGVR